MISFIIPNRGGEHIDYVISQLKEKYPDSECIVITQEDDNPFARGELFNIGYFYAKGSYLCFIDNDIFFEKSIDLVATYEKNKCGILQPFNKIAQVSINEDQSYTVTSSDTRSYKTHSFGGVTFISVENFRKINGFSNLYIGWGREDNELYTRCLIKKVPFLNTTNRICHISHPVRSNNNLRSTWINAGLWSDSVDKNYARNIDDDGYNNTKYEVIYDRVENNARWIGVKNIYVHEPFRYISSLKKQYLDCSKFADIIIETLKKEITEDYVLMGAPRNLNIDNYIAWEASRQMLNKLECNNVGIYFRDQFPEVDKETTIVIGGDCKWEEEGIEYIDNLLVKYPDNKIVFLPTLIFYKDENRADKTANIIKDRKGKTVICCRDNISHEFVKAHFNMAVIYLLPDIVLGLDINGYIQKRAGEFHPVGIINKINLLLSNGGRKIDSSALNEIEFDGITDWPSLLINKIIKQDEKCQEWEDILKDKFLVSGISTIINYRNIYAERVYGGLLGWLLGKNIYLIDDDNHQTLNFYNTWLKDEDIQII